MTAYSMTITNSVRAFGGGPASLWNSYSWNAFKWGEGTAKISMGFVHLVVCDPIAPQSSRGFRLTKLIDAGSIAPDSSRGGFDLVKLLQESLSVDSDSAHQYLIDGAGYYHVFPSNVIDGEARAVPTWAAGGGGSTSWSSGTATSTSWSAA